MGLFRHANRQRSEASRTVYARFQLIYTAVDFGASLAFVAGSLMYILGVDEATVIWVYLAGSLLFAAKPSLRLLREIRLYRMGHVEYLAQRAEP
ncbi:YrhK family protein [Maritimibacter sp. DP1N21-5]|uniref:YrhK family protein n=1 Tax=Maritimibacter sp. DP1N21-5 TaxID=2836867 RepID=UPI001C47D1A5|nr:YrhK family protein [Maritimibacter sp. DP1N21-5]MBV7408361.1 YrhK family protein [Maritimibacter sp. DP1N21-5]